jgi:hypothetical protein
MKDPHINSPDELLAWAVEHDPLGHSRWRLDVYTGWDDSKPPEYTLTATGGDGWSRMEQLKLDPELGEALRPFFQTNSYGQPKGALKLTGILKRWDDDHGSDFLAAAREAKAEAEAADERQTTLRQLRDLAHEAEFLVQMLQRELPPGVIDPELRRRFCVDARAVYDQVNAGTIRLQKDWGLDRI